jgi:hypothetical protein
VRALLALAGALSALAIACVDGKTPDCLGDSGCAYDIGDAPSDTSSLVDAPSDAPSDAPPADAVSDAPVRDTGVDSGTVSDAADAKAG